MRTRSFTVVGASRDNGQAPRNRVPRRLFIVVLACAAIGLAADSPLRKLEVMEFGALARDRALIDLVALQKADLNEVWAELRSMNGESAESARALRERLTIQLAAIDGRFGEVLSLEPSEERRLAFEDARATWTVLVASFLDSDQRAMSALRTDTEASRRTMRGTQRRRFDRVNEQVTAFLDLIRSETEQRESAAVELDRRLAAVNLVSHGVGFALLLVALWRTALWLPHFERTPRLIVTRERHDS